MAVANYMLAVALSFILKYNSRKQLLLAGSWEYISKLMYGLKLGQQCISLQPACQVSILEFDNKTENYYTTMEKSVLIEVVSTNFYFLSKLYHLYPIYKIKNSKIINF